jgi:hypothetical protein
MEKYIIYVFDSNLFLLNSEMIDLIALNSICLCYFETSNITLLNIVVDVYNKGFIWSINSNLSVKNSFFVQSKTTDFILTSLNDQFSAISCEECLNFTIENSTFKANKNLLSESGV